LPPSIEITARTIVTQYRPDKSSVKTISPRVSAPWTKPRAAAAALTDKDAHLGESPNTLFEKQRIPDQR
jgi:hypothetical protein